MAAPTPNRPRQRRLIALAALAAAALAAVVPFARSDAAATPDPTTRTGWYSVVRDSVEIVMDAWVAPAEPGHQVVGARPAKRR